MATATTMLAIVRDAIREPAVWPGGYPRYVVLSDGELIHPECARGRYRDIHRATRAGDDSGWRAVAVTVLWETECAQDFCAQCFGPLESAYGIVHADGCDCEAER